MLAIHYCRQDERTRRHTTEATEIAIGRDITSDLVLDDRSVSRHHCRVVVERGGLTIEDLGSERGTLINGTRIRTATPVRAGDRIYVGAFVLELEQLDDGIGPVEQDLLEAIARGDDNSRMVYADWLEERGDVTRAEFVRLQQALIESPMATPADKAAFLARSTRVRELAASIDLDWRMRIARPAVEGCRVAFEIPCKMDWGALEPTDRPDVRTCNTCRKAVHYCVSERQALEHASRGHCIVLDVKHIGRQCKRCGRDNPRLSRVCLGCGGPLSEPRTRPPELHATIGALPYVAPSHTVRGLALPMELPPTVRRATVACPSCGAHNLPGYELCPACHARLPAVP